MEDHSRRRAARLTGLFYLGIILCGVFAEGVARAGLFVEMNSTATADALRAHMPLFRASIAADVAMLCFDTLVAILFFRLLRSSGPILAAVAMGLRLVQAATILIGISVLTRVFGGLQSGENLEAYNAMLSHGIIYDIGLIFFAGNCVAMMILLRRSGGVPYIITWGIGASGLVYLTGSLVHILANKWLHIVEPVYLLPLLAESALCLWLLIKARI